MLGSAYRHFSYNAPEDGWAEQDPELVWDLVDLTVREAMASCRAVPEVEAVCVSVQGDAVMFVEPPVLDQLDPGAQQRRHVVGSQDQPVLAVNRKDAADHRWIEPEHRQVGAIGILEGGDRGRVRADRERQRFTRFVAEAHAARLQVEGVAAPPVDSRAGRGIPGAVMKTPQLLLEIAGRDRSAHVELEGRRKDPGRHRPVPALKLAGHHAVQVHHPDADRCREQRAHQGERDHPAKPGGTRHAKPFRPGSCHAARHAWSSSEYRSICRRSPMTCSNSSPRASSTGSATGFTCFCT